MPSPAKRTVAVAVVRAGDGEKMTALTVGGSNLGTLIGSPSDRKTIFGRRIGFPGSEESREIQRDRENQEQARIAAILYEQEMREGRQRLEGKILALEARRLAHGLSPIRIEEIGFFCAGVRHGYTEEWHGLPSAMADTEEEIERMVRANPFA